MLTSNDIKIDKFADTQRNGVENRHAFHDVEAALAYAAIQATALGLFIHQMAGFDVPSSKEVYSIPDGYEAVEATARLLYGKSRNLVKKIVATL